LSAEEFGTSGEVFQEWIEETSFMLEDFTLWVLLNGWFDIQCMLIDPSYTSHYIEKIEGAGDNYVVVWREDVSKHRE